MLLLEMRVQDMIRETDFYPLKGLESNRTGEYQSKIQLLAIKQSQLGPVCFFRDRRFGVLAKRENDIHKLCNFMTVGIGQGDNYNEGLYGPLPVLSTGWGVLVYAKKLFDTEIKDRRMREQNYVLVCILYDSAIEERVIAQRQVIEGILEVFFQKIPRLQDIKRKKLFNLRSSLFTVLEKN